MGHGSDNFKIRVFNKKNSESNGRPQKCEDHQKTKKNLMVPLAFPEINDRMNHYWIRERVKLKFYSSSDEEGVSKEFDGSSCNIDCWSSSTEEQKKSIGHVEKTNNWRFNWMMI